MPNSIFIQTNDVLNSFLNNSSASTDAIFKPVFFSSSAITY